MGNLSLGGFLARWAASIALVTLTYNPSGRSFVHWIGHSFPKIEPLQALAGIALLGGWAFFAHATWRALGTFGVAIAAAFFAALIWLFVSWGWLALGDAGAIAWAVLAMLSFLLAVGLSWPHVERRVAGQVVVDEVDR